jgi:hypothetical protein
MPGTMPSVREGRHERQVSDFVHVFRGQERSPD